MFVQNRQKTSVQVISGLEEENRTHETEIVFKDIIEENVSRVNEDVNLQNEKKITLFHQNYQ